MQRSQLDYEIYSNGVFFLNYKKKDLGEVRTETKRARCRINWKR